MSKKIDRLTEDVKIGISKLKKDTVFIVEDKDESSFTIKNHVVGWGILNIYEIYSFEESNAIEYESDLNIRIKMIMEDM